MVPRGSIQKCSFKYRWVGIISGEYFGVGGQLSELLAGVGREGEVQPEMRESSREVEVGSFVGEGAGEVNRVADEVSNHGKS